PPPIAVRLDAVVCCARRSVTTVVTLGASGARAAPAGGSGSVAMFVLKYDTPILSWEAPTRAQSCTKSSADSPKNWSRDTHPAGQAGASMLPERSSTSATVARGGSGTMGTPSCSGHVVAAAGARWLTAVKSARHITAGVWTVFA